MKISKKIYFLSRNRQKMKFLSKKKFNGLKFNAITKIWKCVVPTLRGHY